MRRIRQIPKKKQKRTPNEEIIFQEGRLFGLTQGMQTCNKLMAQEKKTKPIGTCTHVPTGPEPWLGVAINEPRGVEKDLMNWANDPLSSANVEDPVDSLEEEIRSLTHHTAAVRMDDPTDPNRLCAVSCVTEADVMRAIRHYRAKIWELKEMGTRGEER